jgi:predicted RNase H-like HicB family nuclease
MAYTVLLARDRGGGYVVRVPALRGCVTEGDTLAGALDNAREAIQAYVESLELDGLPAPGDRPIIELYDDETDVWATRVVVRAETAVA